MIIKIKKRIWGWFIKRNLIRIKMLENFLVYNRSNNIIINIDKMKILLSKIMNVNNSYINRLVYTKQI